MSPPPSKPELRRQLALRIRSLSQVERLSHDEKIRHSIAALDAYASATQVLAYLAFRDEPALEPLLCVAVRDGKRVFTPIEIADGLRFRAWTGTSGDKDETGPRPAPTLVLVPGRGFDRGGARLGRGRGCYDRALPGLRSLGPVVGVAYECQIVPVLPTEPHDQRVDSVVTEEGVLRVSQPKGLA